MNVMRRLTILERLDEQGNNDMVNRADSMYFLGLSNLAGSHH